MKSIFVLILVLSTAAVGQETALRPHFDQPVQAEKYIIRPGDQLTVTFLKANLEPLKLTVDPEGRIIHSNLGLFDLSYHTLAETKEILKAAIKTLYKVENVVISITDPLLVSFSVTGAVQAPGFYQGYTSERVSEAIVLAGGILPGGSSRRILLSGGPVEIAVDLDLAQFIGELSFNPCLYAGHNLFVPQKSGSLVNVIGEVNNPREIELLPGDSLDLLISLAGGYRGWADTNNVKIIRNGNVLEAKNENVLSGDIIKAFPRSDIPELKKVAIFGAINNAGRFDFDNVSTLKSLLQLSGGFDLRAVKERLTVFRFNPTDASGRLSVDRFPVQNIMTGNELDNDFNLYPGDSIFVPYSVGFV
ncbi:MAG: SLBB domain-containing protein, partial [Candidatus Zixiibacteriota bacterium]